MKKSLKVHGAWLGVSAIAFVIGFKFFPSTNETNSNGKSTSQREISEGNNGSKY